MMMRPRQQRKLHTQLQDTEAKLDDALKKVQTSEKRYRLVFESMADGFTACQLVRDENAQVVDFRFLLCNAAFEEMIGRGRDAIIGRQASELFPWHYREWLDVCAEVVKSGELQRFERVVDAAHRRWEFTVFSYDHEDHFAVLYNDVTDQRRTEAHRQKLVNELNHRVRNTLSTVQSIAAQTLGGSFENAELIWAFESRLLALAKAHSLLASTEWHGVALHELLGQELEPFAGEKGKRYAIDGPDVELGPYTALALAMALHELGANAIHYGALSRPEGEIRIKTALPLKAGQPRLRLTWTERGGPEVTKPEYRGFGTRLIESGLAHELNGIIDLDYSLEGLICTIDVSLEEGRQGTKLENARNT